MAHEVYLSEVNKLSENELGYLEKKNADEKYLYDKTANAGNKNYTKYAKDMWDKMRKLLNGNKQGKAYCALYQVWLIAVASDWDIDKTRKVMCLDGSVDQGGAAAGAENLRQYFIYKKRYDKNPKIGDVSFFDTKGKKEATHVGRVYKLTASYVYTEEANTTKNGKGGVFRKQYSRKNKTIMGYGHPKFDEEVCEVTLNVLQRGDKGTQVATLQIQLNGLGIKGKGKPLAVDKSFGPATEDAVKNAQKKYGFDVTGICDEKLWNKILKGV